MSQIITNPKTYEGNDLETIFFRPLLTGASAVDLGIRVMYNMPVPTTLNFWNHNPNVLKKYAKGWTGGDCADKYQKTINLTRVKAEMGYAAADYFGMVYEHISSKADINLADLSGTELEAAETELFRRAIAESIRATMWLGNTSRLKYFNTFDGFLKKIKDDSQGGSEAISTVEMPTMENEGDAERLFEELYFTCSEQLRTLKSEGNLVLLVTGEVYYNYEAGLLNGNLDSVRMAKINGIDKLYFRGIPVVDIKMDQYLPLMGDLPKSWAILTDRRNLAVAVNTSDFPGSEISMWYNPDEIENRQRAIFMAGCEYLLPELIVAAFEKQ